MLSAQLCDRIFISANTQQSAPLELARDGVEAVSFDCYGTLIDWESGILAALEPILERRDVKLAPRELLLRFDHFERSATVGGYRPYREVLQAVVDGVARSAGFTPTASERDCLVRSLGGWRPFPDTVPALRSLARHFRLAVVSNVDRDLFAGTRAQLDAVLDVVVTAEDVRSYKPRPAHLDRMLALLDLRPEAVLHVAASVRHDIQPAAALGFRTALVERGRLGRPSPAAAADFVTASLSELVDRATVAA